MNRFFTALLLLGPLMPVAAQQQADTVAGRSITVERQYTPIIQDAGKMNVTPQVKTESVARRSITYPYYDKTLLPDLTVRPLASAAPRFSRGDDSRGYARLGGGLYWNTVADFKYCMMDDDRSTFTTELHHLGAFGQKKSSRTSLGLDFARHFSNLTLYANAGAEHEWFNYYGRFYNPEADKSDRYPDFNRDEDLRNRIWNFAAQAGLRSNAGSDWKYFAQLGYGLTNVSDPYRLRDKDNGGFTDSGKRPLTEHRIGVAAGVEHELSTGALGLNFDLTSNFYNKVDPVYGSTDRADTTLVRTRPFVTVKLEPYYAVTGEQAWLHVGLNLDMSMGRGSVLGASPNIIGEWQAQPRRLAFYTQITGRYNARNLHDLLQENRYTRPLYGVNDTLNTYTPVDVTLGMKIHPLEGLLISPFVQFAYTMNDLYYVTTWSAGSYCYPLEGDTRHLRLGLSASYHHPEWFDLSATLAYHHWTTLALDYSNLGLNTNEFDFSAISHSWYRPTFDARLHADVHPLKKWSFQLDAYFATGLYAGTLPKATSFANKTAPYRVPEWSGLYVFNEVKLPAVCDINLGATYVLNNTFSFSGNLTNLANCRHQPLYGYEVQGIGFLLGATAKF